MRKQTIYAVKTANWHATPLVYINTRRRAFSVHKWSILTDAFGLPQLRTVILGRIYRVVSGSTRCELQHDIYNSAIFDNFDREKEKNTHRQFQVRGTTRCTFLPVYLS